LQAALLGAVLVNLPAAAAAGETEAEGARACVQAAAAAEASRHVPDAFLTAIARVESGRADDAGGPRLPWPWSVNAEGVGHFYPTKAEAIASVRALQARGVRSIDVGCLQVNLQQHPGAFADLEQAFDPTANAAYAADFLVTLFGKTGSWPLAAAAYHSLTPGIGSEYQERVLTAWAVPIAAPRAAGRAAGAERVPAPRRKPASSPPAPMAVPEPQIAAHNTPGSPVAAMPSAMGRATQMASAPPIGRPNGTVGRSLAAYRLMPTRLALRPPFKPG
jgi:hypothetical protein